MKQRTLFIIAVVSLSLAFVTAALLYNAQQGDAAGRLDEANRAALVRMHSPTLGPAQAPVTIVEFLDPACETCRAFYPFVKKMMAQHPEGIRLVLRYTPFHSGSDRVVALLEAARKQGRFWPALERLLANQSAWVQHHTAQPALALRQLDGLGLDMAQLEADAAAPGIAEVIARDLEDARSLNVTKTPEFFVNGRPLPRFGYEPLQALVDEELANAR